MGQHCKLVSSEQARTCSGSCALDASSPLHSAESALVVMGGGGGGGGGRGKREEEGGRRREKSGSKGNKGGGQGELGRTRYS